MIGKIARERATALGLDLGAFKTERDLRVALRRGEKANPSRRPCCEVGRIEQEEFGAPWCPVHGDLQR
jgi:hypothetical protein